MGDLPDYTKYITPSTVPVSTVAITGTKAELLKKKSVGDTEFSCPDFGFCEITPALGMKAVLVNMVIHTTVNGKSFKIQALQSGSWADVYGPCYLGADTAVPIELHCFKPTQDVGDGATATIRLYCEGGAVWSACIFYGEEA